MNIDYENLKLLNQPFYQEYVEGLKKVLDSGWFILGNNVNSFEENFAKYIHSNHFVGLASGLDALEIAIKVCDLPPASEIIVPSNTYIATINAILNTGNKPVFVEPDPATSNIDPKRIEEKITSNTKAIMLVHLYGLPCDMDPILSLCKKYNLFLYEDCAQCHGATYNGKTTGTFGTFGAFSFYPTKNLGALGDAGGLSIQDETLYKKTRAFRNYGSNIKYHNEYIGDNSRLDEIQATFLDIKLKALDGITAHKRKLAQIYLDNLDQNKFILPTEPSNCKHVYHIFNIKNDNRDALKQYLLDNQIKTEIHYPIAPCDQKSIKDAFVLRNWTLPMNDFTISKQIHQTELSLPVSTIHSQEDIFRVIEVMNKF
jgi:dTDP-4-amino-4,6-dideoxygalactose transaminase